MKKRLALIVGIVAIFGVSFGLGMSFKSRSLKMPTGEYVGFGLNHFILRLINGEPDEIIRYENDTVFEKYQGMIDDKEITVGFNYRKPFNQLNLVTYTVDAADENEIYQSILDFYKMNYKSVKTTSEKDKKEIIIEDTYKVRFDTEIYNGEKQTGIMFFKTGSSYWGELLE